MRSDPAIPLPSTWGPRDSEIRTIGRKRYVAELSSFLGTAARPSPDLLALAAAVDAELPLRCDDSEPARIDCDGCYRCADRRRKTVAARPRARRQS